MSYKYLDAATLRGKTIKRIVQVESDRMEIDTDDGKCFLMYHSRDCCETVKVHDIVGELQALVGAPLTEAREESSDEWPSDVEKTKYTVSFTWTTYFFETETAKVRVRWLGESNGYYSESVEIEEVG